MREEKDGEGEEKNTLENRLFNSALKNNCAFIVFINANWRANCCASGFE